MRNLSVGGSPLTFQLFTFGRWAIVEPDYLRETENTSVGGWAEASNPSGTMQVLSNTTSVGSFNYGAALGTDSPVSANDANPPTAYYPASGQTVATDNVEFQFTDAWHEYSAMALQVNYAATNGTRVYTYTGYMENEHHDDGTTRHLARAWDPGVGSTYWWRVKCVWGVTNSATYKPTAWSSWASFVYTNAP
jgi:hypothetical protein